MINQKSKISLHCTTKQNNNLEKFFKKIKKFKTKFIKHKTSFFSKITSKIKTKIQRVKSKINTQIIIQTKHKSKKIKNLFGIAAYPPDLPKTGGGGYNKLKHDGTSDTIRCKRFTYKAKLCVKQNRQSAYSPYHLRV